MNVAVIDIGTNSVIILAFKMDKVDGFSIVYESSLEPRLGEKLQESKKLNSRAMERTIRVVGQLLANIGWQKTDQIIAVGTQALRVAENSSVFAEKLKNRTGCELKIISSEDEARYSYFGAISGLLLEDSFVVCDVGGGSTEISFESDAGMYYNSISIGAVTLTDRLNIEQPLSNEKISELKAHIRNRLSEEKCSEEFRTMVASGGTATTIAMLDGKFDTFDPKKIHNYRLSKNRLRNIVKKLSMSDYMDIRSTLFFAPARADIISSGTSIYLELMDKFNIEEMVISQKGLRWGIAQKIDDFLS